MVTMETFDKFYALSAPIRREIIKLLSQDGLLTASAIADKFQVTPSAISQHLKVLVSSNLLDMHKQAQRRIYQINSSALKELESWAEDILGQLDKLANVADIQANPETLKGGNK
jgi:DNA-binding transcriptional ArsR family regulator